MNNFLVREDYKGRYWAKIFSSENFIPERFSEMQKSYIFILPVFTIEKEININLA